MWSAWTREIGLTQSVSPVPQEQQQEVCSECLCPPKAHAETYTTDQWPIVAFTKETEREPHPPLPSEDTYLSYHI